MHQWLFVMDNNHVFYKFSMERDDDFKSLTYGKEILKLYQTNDELSTLVWKKQRWSYGKIFYDRNLKKVVYYANDDKIVFFNGKDLMEYNVV